MDRSQASWRGVLQTHEGKGAKERRKDPLGERNSMGKMSEVTGVQVTRNIVVTVYTVGRQCTEGAQSMRHIRTFNSLSIVGGNGGLRAKA